MTTEPESPRTHWRVLQSGQLPLRPNRTIDYKAKHACTIALLWPDGADPIRENTLIVDPCFTPAGVLQAQAVLGDLGITFADVGRMFITHPHGDHMFFVPANAPIAPMPSFNPAQDTVFTGRLRVEYCPGHHPMLRALSLRGPEGRRVWIASDAVLDEEWLRAWGYYWPNGYSPRDVAETWRSVAAILAGADVVVPGHGDSFVVTADLLRDLIEAFPQAECADRCPDVAETLRARLDTL